MGNEFIADPLNHVKPGDIVTVRVISVDAERKRVGFSMKSDTPMAARPAEKAPANKAKSANQSVDGTAKKHADPTERGSKSGKHSGKPQRSDKAVKPQNQAADKPQKIGSLGALLAQAGLKKST